MRLAVRNATVLAIAAVAVSLGSCKRKSEQAENDKPDSGKTEYAAQTIVKTHADAPSDLTWDEALSRARQKGGEEEIIPLVTWVLTTGDFSKLQALLGEDGKPLDELSRQILRQLALKIDASFFKRTLPGRGNPTLENFEEFASQDPTAATRLAFALAVSGGQSGHSILSRAGWYAGKAHRETALAMILKEGGTNRDAALAFAEGVLDEWSKSDPASACEWVEQISPSHPDLPELAEIVLGNWAVKSPGEAYVWTQRLPEAYANAAKTRLAAGWAANDTTTALEWGLGLDDELRDEVLESAVAAGAQSHPLEVMDWLAKEERLPQELRDDLLTASSEIWARRDPNAASQWIEENQSNPSMIPAARGLIRVLSRQDAPAAVELAVRISGDPRGMEALRSALGHWRKYRYQDFANGTSDLVQRLREEGETSLADTLQAAAANIDQDEQSAVTR